VDEFKIEIGEHSVVIRPEFSTWKAIELQMSKSILDIARTVSSLTLAEKSFIFCKITKLDSDIIDEYLITDFIKSVEVLGAVLNKLIGIDEDK